MRKKHPEHVNLERWLVSYADFITLLFAFFVIMYAISQADMSKFQKVAASMKAAFAPTGPSGMIDLSGSAGGATLKPFEDIDRAGGRAQNLPAGKTNTAADQDPELQEIREALEESISLDFGSADTAEKLQMQFDSRGLIVRMAAKDFFNQGSAIVHQDLRPILDRIGRALSKSTRIFRIEGHTDPSEAKTGGFASAWELSAARAAWVAKYMIERFAIDPKRVGVAGYSYFRPLSSGKDEFSKAKNRRIEIVVLNNQYLGN
ncbi:MAG TPA: hypothetical protein DCS07_11535 [Bdellovibrionales bacterium]|nr:MAG: hypothetical protein A2Z97_09220 [Bdellovibrionales bacterium GWB1_52_6]OFZ02645.1 MAG: hypothetical protein A2X97_08335 [Bdellovibrionales bacterium GWA1_52_35]OFZ38144.1 MAG: hypothetical protein A2070_09200 [Bdellovibrionales bacterium GWC1_52_8]HAR43240.1 hypothetical protein [Bdellovibrionales bacterium]HCM41510.1 hypothetical protein [Bdellovibrionales bacterium]